MPDPSPTRPEQPDDLEERLASIIELDGDARERALDQLRQERPELVSMLRRWQSAAGLFATERLQPFGEADVIPDRIGPYEIGRVLGEGGMGTVVLAEQQEPMRRRVALKLIKPGMGSKPMLARFARERQALAAMNHECIARVFDAGTTATGQPYFVMEYVDGQPITSYCDRYTVSLRGRVELVEQICAGVQHAHQNGVVHRDLKPGNVLVTCGDEGATPKIIDFGLARSLEPDLDASMVTLAGQVLGTPAYMSPEQTRPDRPVDTRTDVYAIGVMLYELVTGTLPLETDTLAGPADFVDYQQRIRDEEPPRPSKRVRSLGDAGHGVASSRAESQRSLVTQLERDVDWIVMTAIEKDPARRYQSAGELAADLRRFLDGAPVLAHAPSTAYRLRKLVARYRVQSAALVAVLTIALVGAAAVLTSWADASFMRDRLEPFVLVGLADEAEFDLWPARPERIPALELWLDRATRISACADVQRNYVATLANSGQDPLDRARHREQTKLLERIEAFLEPVPTARNLAGVRDRLAWAQRVEAATIHEPQALWQASIDRVAANPAYRAMDLTPQLGLVPLGADPDSGLEEFYHPASGAAASPTPTRDAQGALALDAGSGFVFVLIPGGTFEMGSADIETEADERPVHAVTLAPFLVSKFETTQAQWRRLSYGEEPAFYNPSFDMPVELPRITMQNPVEKVSWLQADTICRRLALRLPTEAQWEYACRAGSRSQFAWGDDPASCARYENVADAFAGSHADGWPGFEAWEDGHVVHAPVGSFAPNAFGLHDMHGNVYELCADWKLDYECPVRAGDGLRMVPAGHDPPTSRAVRGGCWQQLAHFARCANRMHTHPELQSDLTGFRPARSLE